MCSPDLKIKAQKALDVFMEDDERNEGERSRLKVMNYVTGNNKFIEDATIARADLRYPRLTPTDP